MQKNQHEPNNYRKDRTFFSVSALSVACLTGIGTVLVLLLSIILRLAVPGLLDNIYAVWILTYAPIFGVGGLLAWLLMRILPKQDLYRPGMTVGYWGRSFCVCMMLMYAGALLGSWISNLISGGEQEMEAFQKQINETPIWLVILVVVIIGPIVEELVFRKLMIDRLIVFGDVPAILFSAITFSLYHGTFSQLFYTFLIGLVFGYIYIRSGRIHNTIILHMCINFLGSVVGLLITRATGVSLSGLTMEKVTQMGSRALALIGGYEAILLLVIIFGIAFFIKALRRLDLRPGERSGRGIRLAIPMFFNLGFAVLVGICLLSLFVI